MENIFAAKDQASGRATDVEKGEARVSNGSSHFQFHNIDLQRASSKGSVLSSAGKVLMNNIWIEKKKEKKNLDKSRRFSSSVIVKSGLLFQSNENGLMECPLCLAELPIEFFPIIQSCHHRSCYDCFQQYLKVEISESRVNIACPECSEPLHPNGES